MSGRWLGWRSPRNSIGPVSCVGGHGRVRRGYGWDEVNNTERQQVETVYQRDIDTHEKRVEGVGRGHGGRELKVEACIDEALESLPKAM